MAIHLSRRIELDWTQIAQSYDKTGEIPLPAIDMMILSDPLSLLIVPSRDAYPGRPKVATDVDRLASSDRLEFEKHLYDLQKELASIAQVESLESIFHCGGLDYEFRGTTTIRLSELPQAAQAQIWALLHALARVSEEGVDDEATRVQTLP